MTIDQLKSELILCEEECECEIAGERLGGNIVKESYAAGRRSGIRIALQLVEELSNDPCAHGNFENCPECKRGGIRL